MSGLAVVLTLVLLAAVMAVVSRPLLTAQTTAKADESDTPERAELEAAREAKYREIRDTDFDYRTGKLSGEDYRRVNGTLRTEAVEILDRLDSLERGAAAEQRTGEQVGEEEAGDEQEQAPNSPK
jgi:TolA-binding protein